METANRKLLPLVLEKTMTPAEEPSSETPSDEELILAWIPTQRESNMRCLASQPMGGPLARCR